MESTELNIRYRSEYQYSDGELAYQIEGDNESYLSLGHARRLDALPLITITTIYISKTTRERSEKKSGIKKNKNTENSTKTKHYDDSEDGVRDRTHSLRKGDDDTLPEDLAESVPGHTYMAIHSKELLNVLRDIISYCPGCSLLGEELRVPEPYRILYLHREELRAYKSKHPQWHDEAYRVECNRHLDVLFEFLDKRYGKAIQDEKNRWARKVPVCTFEYLWLLYKPGEVCYLDDYEGTNPYVTQGILHGGLVGNTAYTYKIEMWNIDYDGYEVGGCSHTSWIAPFEGEKEIDSLKYYPARFHKETEEAIDAHNGRNFQQRLVARGKTFWDLAKEGPCYRQYSGQAATSPFKKVSGRVVVDPLSYFNRSDFETSDIESDDSSSPTIRDGNHGGDRESYSAGCQCQSCASHSDNVRRGKFVGFNGVWPRSNTPPDDKTFFLLCSFRTFAFVLKRRTWVSLHIEDIAEVAEQAYAFEHLVLPNEVKYTLKAISCSYVKEQANSRTQETDIIKGKGEGKIFLLHGPPGTGKTLSAEAVSELTRRPLLSLTCGDLGTTAGEVESRLDRYMSLGEEWGAIVLLDEADVYLESRAVSEVKRNSLVSVFLRALEYYKGLLFLTTNRVNTFDEAFRSRIHVALEYKTLNDNNRRRIWENALDRLMSDRFTVTQMAWEYVSSDKNVLSLKWNGREIRNALQTAISLADYEAEDEGKDIVTIKRTHLERIVAMSANFQEYIGSMRHNKSDSFVAKKKQLRNDFYKETPINGRKLSYHAEEDNVVVSRTKMKGRDERRYPDEDDEDIQERTSNTRKANTKMSSRADSTDRDSVLRSRSQQSKQKPWRSMTMLDEESEEAAPKTRRGTRRLPGSEGDGSEQEMPKPKNRSQPVSRLEGEDSQEALAPKTKKPAGKSAQLVRDDTAVEEAFLKPSRLSRTSTRAVMSREEEEDEEELVRKTPRTASHTTRATRSLYGNARRNASNSRSPAPLKKRMTRTRTAISENEDE